MKKDEIEAVERLRQHLLSSGMNVGPWEKGEDPPDFYLKVEGERFAVEVTNLMDEILVGGKDLPLLSYARSVDKLASEIEEESRKRGTLRGSYQLWVNGPFQDFAKVKKHIKSESLGFLETTKDSSARDGKYLLAADDKGVISKTDFPEEPPELLYGCGILFCSISKKCDAPDGVSPWKTSPNWIDWAAELAEEACELLQWAISEKCQKLEKVISKKILVLTDRSRFMELTLYNRCLQWLHGLDHFHSILVIDVTGRNITIHGPWR